MKIHLIALPESQNLNTNFNFRGHMSTFRAKNKSKSWPNKTKNNVQTVPKQLLKNFEKVQKTNFLTPKEVKNYPSKLSKWAKFRP